MKFYWQPIKLGNYTLRRIIQQNKGTKLRMEIQEASRPVQKKTNTNNIPLTETSKIPEETNPKETTTGSPEPIHTALVLKSHRLRKKNEMKF